jgi:hypothetical protein
VLLVLTAFCKLASREVPGATASSDSVLAQGKLLALEMLAKVRPSVFVNKVHRIICLITICPSSNAKKSNAKKEKCCSHLWCCNCCMCWIREGRGALLQTDSHPTELWPW